MRVDCNLLIVNCKLVFIGAGNVATSLATALSSKGFCVCQIFSRTEQSAKALAERLRCGFTTDYEAVRSDADFYFYCLPDNVLEAITPVRSKADAVHIHTAGSVSVDVFKGKTGNYGVLYPFQTFSKRRLVDFKDVPMLIDANNEQSFLSLQKIANALSCNVVRCNDEMRGRVHLAGVMANNFTNCLYRLSY